MTDRHEPSADAVELASRYLDGDLDATERAAAEADAEVMAWVSRLGGVQRALREPIEADPAVRESALAAALAAFDHPVAGAAPPAPTAVTDLAAARARRTGRVGKWLGAVAAAAAVAVGGVAISGNLGGNTASDSDGATSIAAADTTAAATERAGDARDGAVLTAEAPGAMDAAPPAATTMATGESTTTTDRHENDDATTTAAGATTAAGTEMTEGPTAYALEAADVSAYAAADALELPAGATAPCAAASDGVLVALDVQYADATAVVYRVDAARTIDIYAADDCALLGTFGY